MVRFVAVVTQSCVWNLRPSWLSPVSSLKNAKELPAQSTAPMELCLPAQPSPACPRKARGEHDQYNHKQLQSIRTTKESASRCKLVNWHRPLTTSSMTQDEPAQQPKVPPKTSSGYGQQNWINASKSGECRQERAQVKNKQLPR